MFVTSALVLGGAFADPVDGAAIVFAGHPRTFLTVETVRYDLEDAGKAWQAQTESPHVKIGIVPK